MKVYSLARAIGASTIGLAPRSTGPGNPRGIVAVGAKVVATYEDRLGAVPVYRVGADHRFGMANRLSVKPKFQSLMFSKLIGII